MRARGDVVIPLSETSLSCGLAGLWRSASRGTAAAGAVLAVGSALSRLPFCFIPPANVDKSPPGRTFPCKQHGEENKPGPTPCKARRAAGGGIVARVRALGLSVGQDGRVGGNFFVASFYFFLLSFVRLHLNIDVL